MFMRRLCSWLLGLRRCQRNRRLLTRPLLLRVGAPRVLGVRLRNRWCSQGFRRQKALRRVAAANC